MKFSYNWLREMVEGLDTPPRDLERLITIKTAECEGVEESGSLLKGASAARVVSAEPIGGGHNRKVVVETEKYGAKTVVCGAPNCRPGVRTVYVPLGLKTIDGIDSDGMLASAAELGISGDHSGVIEIDGLLDLTPDHVIEVDNKSLTHRPDLWGHHGMAREVAAISGSAPGRGKKLLDPVKPRPFNAAPVIHVDIEDFSQCPRYSALLFENVTVQPSPLWLQYRLETVGLNPINNIVDVTNFVMAELAQPMHAFDADKLAGHTIFVRLAKPGERIAALNGESYDLDPSNLVIADAGGAVALAGVIGGAASAISGATTRIVLESANFNASSIRKTSSRLKLRTDASMRFEKAQDPVNTVRGLARAFELLEQVSPGIRLAGGLADAYRPPAPAPPPAPPIVLPLDWLDRKLGRAIPPAEVRAILESLEFQVDEIGPRTLSVLVPSWRATKDVSIKDDLVEEVGRMVGYHSIVPAAPLAPARVPPPNPEREFQHHVREMAAAQGFTEVKNYSFVSEEMARAFSLDPAGHVQVANPIAADQNLLRRSLLPGIWKNISANARHFDSFRLFEIGREIHPGGEVPHFAAAIFAKDDGAAGLLELERLAECLLPGVAVRPTAGETRNFEHPRRAADLVRAGAVLGRLFEFHPRMVEGGRAAVLDLDLTQLQDLQPAAPRYAPLRRYPSSTFDLSVVVPARALIGDVEAELRRHAAGDLLSIAFLRDFPVAPGQRSLSYRLTIGAPDRTLTSEEVTTIRSRIIEGMRRDGYELKV
jgi:phenylalanyl-tRNA synthetase beta chain